ncbi:four helix bundle protein [Sphingobacterium sp. SGG-5]|uniref:four helix bundle protein n=1 Tax=Sphingobacterium sp. SGG-5 TaxID=2710881 RepID=UPI0013EA13F8|nr:four helix bundle protein [Sphingobacterium sp. SGG-5]NGM63443.1 four helix bundle protein [Sphingobacterium sp. SGG-5]
MHEFYFEKLSVWQNARMLVKDMYMCTADFPNHEQFGVTSQLRRATMSIAANIAEGMSRAGDKDKLRFLNQAYSSAIEVINFLILSFDLAFLTEADYIKLRNQVEYITNQLQALSKKIRG